MHFPSSIGLLLQSHTPRLMSLKCHQGETLLGSATLKRSPPYLAILTEPDACDSRNRIDETYHAIERATYDGHVDLVVVRVADDLSPIDGEKRNIHKLDLLQRLSLLQLDRQKHGSTFKLIVNNDLEMIIKALSQGILIDGIHVKERNIECIPSIRKQLQEVIAQHGGTDNIIIGTSCHSVKSAIDSYLNVDYLFVGTCYMTLSHPEKNTQQLEGPAFPARIKKELRHASDDSASVLPVYALGGIDETNCHEPVLLGADGVGVIRSVMQAEDPQMVVDRMKKSMSDVVDRIQQPNCAD